MESSFKTEYSALVIFRIPFLYNQIYFILFHVQYNLTIQCIVQYSIGFDIKRVIALYRYSTALLQLKCIMMKLNTTAKRKNGIDDITLTGMSISENKARNMD